MDQAIFESLLKDYITKKVDANNPMIVEYELVSRPRCRVFRNDGVKVSQEQFKISTESVAPKRNRPGQGLKPKRVVTPMGTFSSAIEAAEMLGMKKARIYQLIRKSEEKGSKEYYFDKN